MLNRSIDYERNYNHNFQGKKMSFSMSKEKQDKRGKQNKTKQNLFRIEFSS